MVNKYTPSQGDIVMLQFNPRAGKEQSGYRPAITVSPKEYNKKVGLALFCPITSKIKKYPFEVELPSKMRTKGVILADHIKSLDWKIRKVKFVETVSSETLDNVLGKLNVLLERK